MLYWMRTAVRSDENPALDVAISFAHQLKLPLLVYHAISQHYEYASDRHHTFMLEGARDVQTELQERNISYAFHLATPDDQQPHLIKLGQDAAVVVTEEMPVDPPRRFLAALARAIETPIFCVDTACIVPMLLLKKPFTRAFEFRNATKQLFEERLTRPWPNVALETRPFDVSALEFDALDLQSSDLAELVAKCDIDHSVGPVVDTVGGSTAGYARWARFKTKGLSQYAKCRNNALIDGVSRMSAYLHYGMVSPMQLARDAANIDNAGSQKYLDELLIWRELAYLFCFHHDDHDQWSAIPQWARETLESHQSDLRENIYSWEQLARGKTNDDFWNAAQLSLLRQGELHNNVRMTWAKAILNWIRSPQNALKIMVDLNHRYALDGRDPASYGGLLWCLGQFDRPFEPESNVFGTVRPRSTADHAKRLDTATYQKRVTTPRFDPVPRVAVIGAGISGLVAARTLADHGLSVMVFDKGRGVGGRMSTRRVDGQSRFDHGAQYFTARDRRFQRHVQSWIEQGVVARWPDPQSDPSQKIVVFRNGERSFKPDSQERFVGVPGMNGICKHLAKDLEVTLTTRVEKIEPTTVGIRLTDNVGNVLGEFDRLIVSAPAGQSAELLANFPLLANPVSRIVMQPCWAALVTLPDSIDDDWVGSFIHDSILTWAARNSTKPQRPTGFEDLLLHAGHEWTAENWECDADSVAAEMLDAFWKCSGIAPQKPVQIQAHRWKFAIPENPAATRSFFDTDSGIAACGDWAGGPRVEGAFLSGISVAGRILGTLVAKEQNDELQRELF